ncbi:hypothetical protein BLA29_007306 [Euroglyphus maynei]|uniref:Transmembrane protein n=1 Tax=Euroglyphus maynei TaxID=6958 RepID=A0A1Y3B973_EURMA|nr:hypothetical protein BLA29_007306 [Euroglyphus maynei]
MRIKFIRFERMLELLTKKRNPKLYQTKFVGNVQQSYNYLNDLMIEYDIFNDTWKYLATFSLFWRFIIINFVSYLAIFYDMPPTFQLMYRSIFISENSAFILFLFKVGLIHINMSLAGKRLRQFLYQKKFNSSKLSLKMKTLEYITFLQEPKRFGQMIISGHLLKLKHMFIVSGFCCFNHSIFQFKNISPQN